MKSLWCQDEKPWDWLWSHEVKAFEAAHVACDDGMSVGVELIVTEI